MSDAAPSRLALVLTAPVGDVGAVVEGLRVTGDVDRVGAVGTEPTRAQEVHWGGRMQRAVVRALDDEDGAPLVRVESFVASDGWSGGTRRQAQLVAALARALGDAVVGVRDVSARSDRDLAWLGALTEGRATHDDVVAVHDTGATPHWLATHGAARFGVPDIELYGVAPDRVDDARALVRRVIAALLDGGLDASLSTERGVALRLVPVLEVWRHLPLEWPGVGRAGTDRGPGLDGPRATLSVLRRARLGRHPIDLEGVLARS